MVMFEKAARKKCYKFRKLHNASRKEWNKHYDIVCQSLLNF